MRYLAVGAATAVASAVLTAAFFLVFVDRTSTSDGNIPTLVYVARESIPKGTLVKRPDLFS